MVSFEAITVLREREEMKVGIGEGRRGGGDGGEGGTERERIGYREDKVDSRKSAVVFNRQVKRLGG